MGYFAEVKSYLSYVKPLSDGFIQRLARVGNEHFNVNLHLEIRTLDSLMRVLVHKQKVLHVVEGENMVSHKIPNGTCTQGFLSEDEDCLDYERSQ